MKQHIVILSLGVLALSCNSGGDEADATGSFEAIETIVSAEASGKIIRLDVAEGGELKAGQIVGMIDSTQLYLSKLQLLQSQRAILSGRPDTKVQLEALQRELAVAVSDMKRIENLVKGEVASQKQLDDANARVTLIQSRIDAQRSVLNATTTSLNEQAQTVAVQLAQVEEQLRKCKIICPVNGTVLTTYANVFEMTATGKPLFKIADLSEIELKAYITQDQFAQLKVGQAVSVLADDADDKMKSYPGTVSWINSKAEFTPKTIQTKNERANLVYAIKVRVKNDGLLKIGMYGEVKSR